MHWCHPEACDLLRLPSYLQPVRDGRPGCVWSRFFPMMAMEAALSSLFSLTTPLSGVRVWTLTFGRLATTQACASDMHSSGEGAQARNSRWYSGSFCKPRQRMLRSRPYVRRLPRWPRKRRYRHRSGAVGITGGSVVGTLVALLQFRSTVFSTAMGSLRSTPSYFQARAFVVIVLLSLYMQFRVRPPGPKSGRAGHRWSLGSWNRGALYDEHIRNVSAGASTVTTKTEIRD